MGHLSPKLMSLSVNCVFFLQCSTKVFMLSLIFVWISLMQSSSSSSKSSCSRMSLRGSCERSSPISLSSMYIKSNQIYHLNN